MNFESLIPDRVYRNRETGLADVPLPLARGSGAESIGQAVDVITRAEWGFAILASLVAIWLHYENLMHAGGLWRDEVTSVNIVEAPTIWEMWGLRHLDSFPIGFATVLRGWTTFAGKSDFALRFFGFLVGGTILALVWWNHRRLASGVPMLSLCLFVLAPAVVRYGDGVRGYGLGILTLLVLPPVAWTVVQRPTLKHGAVFIVVCLMAVQTSFTNCVLLLAIGIGAGVVSLLSRSWKALAIISAGGLLAAASMIPYLSTLEKHKEWNDLVRIPVTPAMFIEKLVKTLEMGEGLGVWLWAGSLLVTLVGGAQIVFSGKWEIESRRRVLFCTGVLFASGICLAGYFHFLKVATDAWYYIPLLGLWGVLADVVIHHWVAQSAVARSARLVCCVLGAAFMVYPCFEVATMRLTNIDLVADQLKKDARAGDLILVNPWQAQNVFTRYYQGVADWSTVPALPRVPYQPYLEYKQCMSETDALRPVLERIALTLRSGGSVWYLGLQDHLLRPPNSEDPMLKLPRPVPPAPLQATGWQHSAYDDLWRHECLYFLKTHAKTENQVSQGLTIPVQPQEKVLVHRYSGWQEVP